jgi:hypothetical protein
MQRVRIDHERSCGRTDAILFFFAVRWILFQLGQSTPQVIGSWRQALSGAMPSCLGERGS